MRDTVSMKLHQNTAQWRIRAYIRRSWHKRNGNEALKRPGGLRDQTLFAFCRVKYKTPVISVLTRVPTHPAIIRFVKLIDTNAARIREEWALSFGTLMYPSFHRYIMLITSNRNVQYSRTVWIDWLNTIIYVGSTKVCTSPGGRPPPTPSFRYSIVFQVETWLVAININNADVRYNSAQLYSRYYRISRPQILGSASSGKVTNCTLLVYFFRAVENLGQWLFTKYLVCKSPVPRGRFKLAEIQAQLHNPAGI